MIKLHNKYRSRVGAAVMTAALLMSGVGSMADVQAAGDQIGVRTQSQTQMVSDKEAVYLNTYGDTGERTQNFDSNWKFYYGDAGNAEGASFDDSKWRNVNLPHDYSIEQAFTSKGEAESGYLPGGTGWYRKKFTLPEDAKDKVVRIDFDGVYMNSTVWVNGKQMGTHPYGYTPFSYDITEALKFGEENVIAVKVDHKTPSSRWYSGSGIYRSVNLTVTDKVHVDLYGTKIETPELATNQTAVKTSIKTSVANASDKAAEVTLTHKVFKKGDASETAIGTVTTDPVSVEAGKTAEVSAELTAQNPELWSNTNPALYIVRTEVRSGEQVVDTYDTEYGFRYFNFDANTGFSLNGQNMKLKGVCMHHDQGALGAAANRRAIERQVEILQEMGCNSIRVTHNPAASALIEVCNEKGMILIEEAFDGWVKKKNGNTQDFSKWFKVAIEEDNKILGKKDGMTWAQFDLEAMIKRGENAPSIIMWSLGNEVVEGLTDPAVGYPEAAADLIKWAEGTGTTKLLTFGGNKLKNSNPIELEIADKVHKAGGVVGYNYVTSGQLQAGHKAHPDWKIYGSETASSVNSRGIYNRTTDTGQTADKQLTSYDGSAVGWGKRASDAWYTTIINDFVAGEYVWTGFDYIGEPTHWNGIGVGAVGSWPSPKNSYFGIIDTAGFPKDSYYLYQSQWNDSKHTLHVLPAWNEDVVAKDRNGNVPVVVYSDAAAVELYFTPADGGERTLIGRKEFTKKQTDLGYTYQLYEGDDKDRETHKNLYLTWNVPYADGTIEAVAYDEGGQVITDTCGRSSVKTTGEEAKLAAAADRTEISADGKDLSYITVDVTDAEGNIVPDAKDRVTFKVEGDGVLVGVDNGNSPDHDPYKADNKTAFSGKVLAIVQSTKQAGNIKVTATAKGLESSTVNITTTPAGEGGEVQKQADSLFMSKHYYVKVGNMPELPKQIEVRYTDGSAENKEVVWDAISQEQIGATGSFVVNGVVDGKHKVSVNVTMIDQIGGLLNYSVTIPVGTEPDLPETRPAVLANGEVLDAAFPVEWEAPEKDAFAKEGTVVINGTSNVLGQEIQVTASVRAQKEKITIGASVSDKAARLEQDIPKEQQSDTLKAVNDGQTAMGSNTSGGPNPTAWTNWTASKNGDKDAQIVMGYDTAQRIGEITVHFARNNSDIVFPDAGKTEIYIADNSAAGFEDPGWKKVEAEEVIGTEKDYVTPYTYKLDQPIEVTAIKFKIQNKDVQLGGNKKPCTGITEIELKAVQGEYPVYKSAKLAKLSVNGEEVPESALEAGTYNTPAIIADVTYEAFENAAVTELPVVDNQKVLIIESEDHMTRNKFVINLDQEVGTTPADDARDYPIDKMGVEAASANALAGQGTEGPAELVKDKETNTHWHTNYDKKEGAKLEHRRITLSVADEDVEAVTLDALRYYPRVKNGGNGRVSEYLVEYSTNGTDWTEISKGNWNTDEAGWMLAEFNEPIHAKYVRLTGVHTVANSGADKHMAVAELRLRTVKQTTDIADGAKVEASPIEKQVVPYVNAENPVILKPEQLVLTNKETGEKLRYGVDYKVAYENNTDFGTATAVVTGISNYSGELRLNFEIEKAPVVLETISVKTGPTKTTYKAGETFDPTGLVLMLANSDLSTVEVAYGEDTKNDFTFEPSLDTKLTEDMSKVTVTYGGKSAEIAISVQNAPSLRDELGEAIANAENIGPNGYTKDSYEKLQDALKNAKEVYGNDKATEEEIQKALDELNAAMTALKPVTPTPGPGGSTGSGQGGQAGSQAGQNGQNGKPGVAKTGDVSPIVPLVLLAFGAAGVIAVMIRRKKNA